MAMFDDLWDRLQGRDRDLYQDLEERYQDLCGNWGTYAASGNWGTNATDSAIGRVRQLTVDEFERGYPSGIEYTITVDADPYYNIQTATTSDVSYRIVNGETIHVATTGWYTGCPSSNLSKEKELDDVSEEELMRVIGLEAGDV